MTNRWRSFLTDAEVEAIAKLHYELLVDKLDELLELRLGAIEDRLNVIEQTMEFISDRKS